MGMYKPEEPFRLHRTTDPQTSVEAAHKVDTAKMKQLVHQDIIDAGFFGITAREIADRHPDLPYSSVTSRPAELERDGLIYYKGDKRNGARIIRDKKWENCAEQGTLEL